jgi:hypothetical protein
MNTKSTTSRVGIAAAIAGIALAATACGTEKAPEPDRAGQPPAKTSLPPKQSLRSPDAIERAARARAEHADAKRWARGHAGTQCRREGHPAHGMIRCAPTSPSDQQFATRRVAD